MLGIRATPREDTAITPAQAVFGSALVLPGQLVSDPETSLDDFMMQIKSTLSRSENLSTRHNTAADKVQPTELPQDLLDASHVLVRRDGHVPPLAPLYDGPYAALRRSMQYFTIQMGSREEVVSTSRLKACHTPDVVAAAPRRRGHPPRSVVQLGLPPRCTTDHPCTPPAQSRAGEGVEPHGWPPLPPPRGGGSGGRFFSSPGSGTSSPGPGTSSPGLGTSSPGPGTSSSGAGPSSPGPVSILRHSSPPAGRPQKRVRFGCAQGAPPRALQPPPPPVDLAQAPPGTLFPDQADRVFAPPGEDSTSAGRRPRVRRRLLI